MTNIKSITDLDICTEIKEDKVLREVYFRVLYYYLINGQIRSKK